MPDGEVGALSYEVLANALFENYEGIYDVDLETGAYNVYYQSEPFRALNLTRRGDDFFRALHDEVTRVVDSEDLDFVLHMLARDALVAGVKQNKYYSLVYRIVRDGRRIYHRLRATFLQVDGQEHVLIGVTDVDSTVRLNEAREKELAKLKAELDASRVHNSISQMKPHFLYNALGSIQEVMLEDPARAAGLLEDFTVHLRGFIKALDGDRLIPFEQEVENIKAYVNIEKMRFGDRLEMRYDLEEMDFRVLPLSIQPLVENAIRHGIYLLGPQGGSVTLSSRDGGDAWVVRVSDTGAGFDVVAYERSLVAGETDSTGLRNICFRLEKIMGASLDIASEPGLGTTVTVRIPKGAGLR